MMFRLLALCVAWIAVVGAVPVARPPLVLAAASLQEALGEAADAFTRTGRARPVLSFAASSVLARQVMAGGRADVFVSADQEWMDALAARRLIDPASRADLAGNRLVVVARAGPARVAIGALPSALGSGRLALADPDSVPAGRYARAALTKLRVWPQLAARVVRAENVRAALALVERGAAPYGIVYATDARASRRVRIVAVFPAASHPPIRYPIALLASSRSRDAAAFRAFLLSRPGQAILARHGFTRP